MRRNIWLVQTHWQLVWYFYFGLWVQSIILFSLAVKILTSIDNSWLNYATKTSAICQLTQAAALSPKENYLKIDWQHWTVPSQFLIKEIRSFNSCFTLWYWVLLHFVYLLRNTANHVQLVTKWKTASNIRSHSEGSEKLIFIYFKLWKCKARQYKILFLPASL